MSGLEIMSGFNSSSRPPTLSGSSASTGGDHSRQHSFSSFPGNLDHLGGHRTTPPDSPVQRAHGQASSINNTSKPPGLGAATLPSPIGKSGSANNSVDGSAEYINLGRQHNTLFGDTGSSNNSASDAGPSLNRVGSPWGDAFPQPPQLVQHSSDGNASWNAGMGLQGPGSFDHEDIDHDDGLHGLGALRERAQSSPGPVVYHKGQGSFASSPPVSTDMFGYQNAQSPLHSEGDNSSANRNYPADPRRSRAVSKSSSRPPLRGGGLSMQQNYNDNNLSFGSTGGDRNFNGQMAGLPPGHHNEGGSMNDLGSQPRHLTGDIGNRGRSLSLGTLHHHHQDSRGEFRMHSSQNYMSQSQIDHSHTQKFGSLPNLGVHVQHQRLPSSGRSQHPQMQQPQGHVRSYSNPGLSQHILPAHDESLSYGRSLDHNSTYRGEGESIHSGSALSGDMRYIQQTNLSRSVSAGANLTHGPGMMQGRSSVSHPSLASGFEYGDSHSIHRRHTVHISHDRQMAHSMHSELQRRDRVALEFMDRQPSNTQVIATHEELKMYGIHPPGSARGPGHGGGGVHNRAHSDGGATLSAMTGARGGAQLLGIGHDLRSSGRYGNGPSQYDDDLGNDLVGEHIADPGDEDGGYDRRGVLSSLPPHGYGMDASAPHPLHQATRHGYSASAELAPRTVYNVKFKRTQRNFVSGPRVDRDLEVGCYVKVEADRGEDLGIIIGKVSSDKFNGTSRSSFRGGSSPDGGSLLGPTPGLGLSGLPDLKRIIRPATHDEVSLLSVKRQEEEELLNICRTKVRQRALPMHVVDAEYQFDRHKLTFFFEAEGRIDFRELVRDLFSMYKTRIWMQQLDKNVSGAPPTSIGGDYNLPSAAGPVGASDSSLNSLGPAGIAN